MTTLDDLHRAALAAQNPAEDERLQAELRERIAMLSARYSRALHNRLATLVAHGLRPRDLVLYAVDASVTKSGLPAVGVCLRADFPSMMARETAWSEYVDPIAPESDDRAAWVLVACGLADNLPQYDTGTVMVRTTAKGGNA